MAHLRHAAPSDALSRPHHPAASAAAQGAAQLPAHPASLLSRPTPEQRSKVTIDDAMDAIATAKAKVACRTQVELAAASPVICGKGTRHSVLPQVVGEL